MRISNKAYDAIKNLITLILPEIGTLYFALAQIWGLPYAEKVVGTIAAITVFLGVFIKISSVKYYREEDAIMDESKYWSQAMDITSHDEDSES